MSSTELTDGNWQHIAFTYTFATGSTAKWYVNGSSVTATWDPGDDGNDAPKTNNDEVALCMNRGGVNHWAGDISDVIILNTTLSATDISNLYDKTKHAAEITTSQNYLLYAELADDDLYNSANRTDDYFSVSGTTKVDGIDGEQPTGMTNDTRIDLAHSFENHLSEIITAGSGGDPDVSIREIGNVINNGTHYIVYYTGVDSGGISTINAATASDPDGTWTKFANNPIIDIDPDEIEDPYVVLDDGQFHLWAEYKDGSPVNAIGHYITSNPDGVSDFTLEGSHELPLGAGGTWDDEWVASPVVWLEGSTWYMLYEGYDEAVYGNGNGRIGLATASNPNGTWTKDGSNPVIDVGAAGTWNDEEVVPDDIKLIGSNYYLLGHGTPDVSIWRSGLFISSDLTTWTEPTLPKDAATIGSNAGNWMYLTSINNKFLGNSGGSNNIEKYQMFGDVIESETVTVSDEIALEESTSIITTGTVTVSDDIALEDSADVVTMGTVTVSDEIVLEDSGATGASNTVTVSDEIVLEDVIDADASDVSYNAIVIKVNKSPFEFKIYTNATRMTCDASTTGGVIFNSDVGNLNICDGSQWILPDGTPS